MQQGDQVWMFTSKGALMPCTFVKQTTTPGGLEFAEVESSSHKLYTCNPANIFDDTTGRLMLIQRRAEALTREGYQISLRPDGSFRIYCPKKHGETGGYLLREIVPGHLNCTCAHYHEHGHCKHQFGVCGLLYQKAHECDQAGKFAHAATYRDLATRINHGLSLTESTPPAPLPASLTPETRVEVTAAGVAALAARKTSYIAQNASYDFP